MSDEEFDDEPDIDEDGDDELEELDDDALVDDALAEGDDAADADAAEALPDDDDTPIPDGPKARPKRGDDEDDDVVDLDEEHHPDDIEASLDVLLKEKTAAERLDEDDLDDDLDDGEPDDRGSNRITPRRADEFLCSSCFLVLPLSQLADPKRQLCRDCV